MLRTQSDARLVDLVRAGHSSAFEAIVQRYQKPLLGYCSRLLPASRAEDAVQQTFLKAYQAMVSGDAELTLRPWLYRIAHNASLNLLRQNGWSHEALHENMDGVTRPDQALELRERLRATVAAVQALPERQRDAVLLREIEGLSYEEIALALGVGDGAVRQLLHRARATLRAGLTAVTPLGLLERVTAALAGSGGGPTVRVADVAAGAGLGAGAVKVGAAVLATGAIATGVVAGPLVKHPRHSQSTHAVAADAAPVGSSDDAPAGSAPTIQVDDRNSESSHHSTLHRVHQHGGSNSGEGSDDQQRSSPRSGDGGDDNHSSSPVRHQRRGEGGDDQQRSLTRHSGDRSGTIGDDGLRGGRGESDDDMSHLSGDGGGDRSGSDGGTVTTPTSSQTPTGTVPADGSSWSSGSGSSGSGGYGGD
jgi:RNA polymerase sigma factor (sigma-70 family)